MKEIYFDHASSTPLDRDVLKKMKPYFTDVFGNANSLHGYGRQAMKAVDTARDTIAKCLNASPSELYFTSGGTEADNWAILGSAYAMKKQGRTRVLISSVEHHAVLSAGERLKEQGFDVRLIPVKKDGKVDLDALQELATNDTAVVAVMWVNNETGVRQPIEEIGKIAKSVGAIFFSDAVQASPYFDLDVKKSGVDILSVSAHKIYGPKGVGCLFVRRGVKIEKLISGGEQERGLRGGTSAVPNIVGFGYAFEKAVKNRDENNRICNEIKELFLQEIKDVDGAEEIASDTPIVNVRFSGVDNASFLYKADLSGIAVSAGSACASNSVKPSHVLLAMGFTESEAKECVRFSFGKHNTKKEVVKAVEIIKELVSGIKNK